MRWGGAQEACSGSRRSPRLGLAIAVAAAAIAALPSSASAAFPGSNGLIYFTRDTGPSSDIWAVGPTGKGLVQITHSGVAGQPAISPDGQKLLFTQTVATPPPATSQIFVADADGSNQQQITQTEQGAFSPAWAPGGKTFAFSQLFIGNIDIYTAQINSYAPFQKLTTDPAADTDPQFSPDGETIAYDNLSGEGAIFTMSAADGSNNAALVEGGLHPNFDPSGAPIAFQADPEDSELLQLFTIPPAGQDPSRLLSDDDSDTQPAYSPKGDQIVFSKEPGMGSSSSPGLYLVTSDGSGTPTQITDPPSGAFDKDADWGVAFFAQTCNARPATVIGTGGTDVLVGTRRRDVIHALGGDDTIRGLAGNDVVCGGTGDDELRGGKGRDLLGGGSGDDDLFGGAGQDRLRGGSGDDRLVGDRGLDLCMPGSGRDHRRRCERSPS